MKKSESKKYPKVKKIILPILLLLIIILALFYIGIFQKPCLDESCFKDALSNCNSAQYVKQKNNNLYVYTIFNSIDKECSIDIKLERLAPGSDPDLVRLLEGKSMSCKIPKTLLAETNLDDLDNILQYCTGELKEGILELIIQKMYTLIIENLDEIVQQSKEFLTEV